MTGGDEMTSSGTVGVLAHPAISIAANARYGFAAVSGGRNSTRFAFGLAEYIGIRHAADQVNHHGVQHYDYYNIGFNHRRDQRR